MRDETSIDYFHEASLALKLGYSLFCRLPGIHGDLVVRDVCLRDNCLEVRTLEGWRKPESCWAIGPEEQAPKPPPAEQPTLF
jgi:hypothetical protein